MPSTLPELTSNPLTLIRSLPTQLVPIDRIKAKEGLVNDEIFLSKYSSFLLGKAPVHDTRVSLDLIRRGFWKRSDAGWELVVDPFTDADIAEATAMVRLGSRPVLHLYENPNPSDGKRFVCADDVVMHAVYEKLGLSKVPVALMAKPRALEESCLSVRCFPRKGKNHIALLDGVVPVTHELVPSILGQNKPDDTASLERLILVLADTKSALKRFHQPGATTLHYHHTLYSVLLRAGDCVESMQLLIEAGKPLIAASLLRSLHELALVFYVDWLAPGQTYRYLQMASVQSEKEWEVRCEQWCKADITAGSLPLEAKNIKDAHLRAFRLGSVVGERARLFPLGERVQRDVYSFLSDVIHHDFSMTARYAHTLDHGDEAIYSVDVVRTIVHLADILVAAMITRIRDDIGSPPATAPRGGQPLAQA
jgi:hypothetical protein